MTTRTFRRLHALLNRAMLTIAHPDRPPALLRIDPEQAAKALPADGPAIWTPAAPAEHPDREQLRERYAAAIAKADGVIWEHLTDRDRVACRREADAVMAVRDTELEHTHTRARTLVRRLKDVKAERDAARRELADLKRWCETEGQARAAERKKHLARADAINRVLAARLCGDCRVNIGAALDGTQQPGQPPAQFLVVHGVAVGELVDGEPDLGPGAIWPPPLVPEPCDDAGPWVNAHACYHPAGHEGPHEAADGCNWRNAPEADRV